MEAHTAELRSSSRNNFPLCWADKESMSCFINCNLSAKSANLLHITATATRAYISVLIYAYHKSIKSQWSVNKTTFQKKKQTGYLHFIACKLEFLVEHFSKISKSQVFYTLFTSERSVSGIWTSNITSIFTSWFSVNSASKSSSNATGRNCHL